MLFVRRRILSAASGARSSFDLFSKSRDVVGVEISSNDPPSKLKRAPSARVKRLVDEIMELTLIEAADLCDLCQEQLSVNSPMQYPSSMFAAQMGAMPQMFAPQQTMAPPPPAAAAPEPEPVKEVKAEVKKPSVVAIKLVAFDAAKKVQTVKEVRAITNLGLKEAKEAVEAAPKILKKGVAYEEALALKLKLEETGATVELE